MEGARDPIRVDTILRNMVDTTENHQWRTTGESSDSRTVKHA